MGLVAVITTASTRYSSTSAAVPVSNAVQSLVSVVGTGTGTVVSTTALPVSNARYMTIVLSGVTATSARTWGRSTAVPVPTARYRTTAEFGHFLGKAALLGSETPETQPRHLTYHLLDTISWPPPSPFPAYCGWIECPTSYSSLVKCSSCRLHRWPDTHCGHILSASRSLVEAKEDWLFMELGPREAAGPSGRVSPPGSCGRAAVWAQRCRSRALPPSPPGLPGPTHLWLIQHLKETDTPVRNTCVPPPYLRTTQDSSRDKTQDAGLTDLVWRNNVTSVKWRQSCTRLREAAGKREIGQKEITCQESWSARENSLPHPVGGRLGKPPGRASGTLGSGETTGRRDNTVRTAGHYHAARPLNVPGAPVPGISELVGINGHKHGKVAKEARSEHRNGGGRGAQVVHGPSSRVREGRSVPICLRVFAEVLSPCVVRITVRVVREQSGLVGGEESKQASNDPWCPRLVFSSLYQASEATRKKPLPGVPHVWGRLPVQSLPGQFYLALHGAWAVIPGPFYLRPGFYLCLPSRSDAWKRLRCDCLQSSHLPKPAAFRSLVEANVLLPTIQPPPEAWADHGCRIIAVLTSPGAIGPYKNINPRAGGVSRYQLVHRCKNTRFSQKYVLMKIGGGQKKGVLRLKFLSSRWDCGPGLDGLRVAAIRTGKFSRLGCRYTNVPECGRRQEFHR
ncbi:hypothetical protein Bbelb_340220 [Branchiostoma belcheri]|nr:hypothetical protein Bbelb_340220 [Branchiostoma belcheri]